VDFVASSLKIMVEIIGTIASVGHLVGAVINGVGLAIDLCSAPKEFQALQVIVLRRIVLRDIYILTSS
jgi:hypothetical protein